MSTNNFNRLIKKIGLIAGPIAFIFLHIIHPFGNLSQQGQDTLAIASWMLLWWMTEAISISVTALLPILLLPVLSILSIENSTSPYASPIVFLFMGGFVIALAMEKWQLHRRIALNIIRLTGTHADGIIMGFMLSTALLSMWISNTATTVMMLPIALSVIQLLMHRLQGNEKQKNTFSLSMMIGIAYSANIGGISTLIGTPPNVVLKGFIEKTYHVEVSFLDWIIVGVPFSILLLIITYLLIVKIIYPSRLGNLSESKTLIKSEISKLGKISLQEKSVFIVFLLAAFLWIFRSSINAIIPNFQISDTGIAIFLAIILFVIPCPKNKEEKESSFILVWKDMKKLPWGILLLFGGGLSLATAFKETGIIDAIGENVKELGSGHILWISILLIATMLFMTEVMSNVALVIVFLPVVAGIVSGFNIPPLLICIPVTMASSCAFMLPMSTPPNAIVFASGHIKIPQMVRIGFFLNIISIILLSIFSQTIIKWIFI